MSKRFFALLLCLCLCLSLLPAASAEDIVIVDEPEDEVLSVIDEPDAAAPGPDAERQASVIASGKCGDSLNWMLFDDMLLQISGSGDMYDYSVSSPSPWFNMYSGRITRLTIDNGVTHIGAYAFAGCSSMAWSEEQGHSLPYTLKSIGEAAFIYCRALDYVDLGRSITSIGLKAFSDCSGLRRVTLRGGPNLGGFAFSNCSSLEEISFLGDAPVFPTLTFQGTAATAWYPPDNSSWTASVRQNYGGSLTWTAGYHGWCGDDVAWDFDPASGALSLSGIGKTWSYENTTYSASGSSGNTYMDPSFFSISGILSVTVGSGITSLGLGLFTSQRNMESISLPDTLESIERAAFSDCRGLKRLDLPASVKDISSDAFYGCSAITEIHFLGHPPTNIGKNAFSGLTATAYYPPVWDWTSDVRQNYGGTLSWVCDDKIGANTTWELYSNGLLWIGGSGATWGFSTKWPAFYAFRSECISAVFGSGVTGVGAYLLYGMDRITTVDLSASLTSISAYAFSRMSALRTITFKGSAPSFGTNCFSGVTATAWYPAGDSTWTSSVMQNYGGTITWMCKGQVGDDVTWTLSGDGTLTLSGTGPTWDFVTGYPSFYGNKSEIKSLVVEDGVTALGKYLFDYLAALETADLGKDVELVDRYCFRSCSSLYRIRFRGHAPTIGSSAFQGVDAVALYYPVYSWTSDVMQDYDGTITWACDNKIGDNVTWYLSSYGSLDISGSGSTWDYPRQFPGFYNFREECKSLFSYNGVTRLGDYLFYGMVMLNKVYLPDSLTAIGNYAFASCSVICVDFHGDAPSFGTNVFRATDVVLASYPANGTGWSSLIDGTQGASDVVWAANYAGSKVWTYLDYVDLNAGSLGFTVENDDGNKALLVAARLGDEYMVRDCTMDGSYHTFTLALRGGVNHLAIALKGDVDLNGKVALKDNLMLKKHIAGTATLSGLPFLVGDVDGSGTIKLKDTLTVKKVIAGTDSFDW